MITIYVDSLNLTNESAGWGVSSIRGLESPSVSVTSFPLSGQDGIDIPSIYIRERRITIEGFIRKTCLADLSEARQLLSSKVFPVRTANEILQNKTLRIVITDVGDFTIPMQVVGLSMAMTNPLYCRYQLDILASDFSILSTTGKSATVTKSTGGGLSLPFSLPFSFVGGVDGSASVTNSGDIATYPTIRFNGPLTNPRLYNDENGLFIQLNTTIDIGDYIIIDTLKKTVLENGSVNKLSTMTENSRWLYISPGENTLSLTSGNSGDTGTAVVSFSDAYSAI